MRCVVNIKFFFAVKLKNEILMLYSIVKDVRPVHLSFMGLAIFLLKTDRNLLSVRFWKSYGDGLFIASIFFSYLYRAHNNINIVN